MRSAAADRGRAERVQSAGPPHGAVGGRGADGGTDPPAGDSAPALGTPTLPTAPGLPRRITLSARPPRAARASSRVVAGGAGGGAGLRALLQPHVASSTVGLHSRTGDGASLSPSPSEDVGGGSAGASTSSFALGASLATLSSYGAREGRSGSGGGDEGGGGGDGGVRHSPASREGTPLDRRSSPCASPAACGSPTACSPRAAGASGRAPSRATTATGDAAGAKRPSPLPPSSSIGSGWAESRSASSPVPDGVTSPCCSGGGGGGSSASGDAALQRVHDWQRRFQGEAGVGRGGGLDAECGGGGGGSGDMDGGDGGLCDGVGAERPPSAVASAAAPPALALAGTAAVGGADKAGDAPPAGALPPQPLSSCCGDGGDGGVAVQAGSLVPPATVAPGRSVMPERLRLSPRSMGAGRPPTGVAKGGGGGGGTPSGGEIGDAPSTYASVGSNGSNSNQDTVSDGFVSPTLRLDLADIRLLRQLFHKHVPAGRSTLTQAATLDMVMEMLTELESAPAGCVAVPHGMGSMAEEMTAVNSELAFIFELFDEANKDEITLKQLVAGCAILSSHTCSDRLSHVFQYCDSTRSGRLQLADLARAVRAMCLTRVTRGAAHSKQVSLASFPELDEIAQKGEVTAVVEKGDGGERAASPSIALRRLDTRTARALTSKVVARASRHVDEDNMMRLGAFKSWAATDDAVCQWVRMPGSRTKVLLSAVRKLREHLAYVEELRSLGFDELTISMTTQTAATASVTSSMCSVASASEAVLPSQSATATPGSSATALASKAPSSESPSGTPIPRRCDSDDTSSPFEIDYTSLKFEARIGEGSYADVWKGRWLDSPVAIKVLKTRINAVPSFKSPPLEQVTAAHATGGAWASIGSSAGASRPTMPTKNEDRCNGVVGCDVPKMGVSQRFLSEVQLLSTLRHPNVLLYMGACVRPSQPLCIVSELVDGGSLHQILHAPRPKSAAAKKAGAKANAVRNGFSPNERVKLALDIARGMLYLHSSRPPLLHRDLKASNILIDTAVSNGALCSRAIICDFGLSRLETMPTQREASEQGSLVGTVATMSPEVISGERYSAAADVYSFGIVIWELFSGLLPFAGMNPAQVMFSVTARELRPTIKPGMMPAELASLVQLCWRTQPNSRPSFLDIVHVIGGVCDALNIQH